MDNIFANDSEYTVHCVRCLSTSDLRMMAHRNQGKIVGWIFVCLACEPFVSGAELNVDLIDSYAVSQLVEDRVSA